MKETVDNPRGSVEKLSPKAKGSVEGADTVLMGSLRAPEGFSEGKPKAARPRGHIPRRFDQGKYQGSPHTALHWRSEGGPMRGLEQII